MNHRLKFMGLAALAACMGGTGLVHAQTLSTAQTYANLVFSFSSSLKSGSNDYTVCNELRVDATGDFVNSTKFLVYGALNCPSTATAYTAAGSGYFGFDASVNMAFLLGSGLTLQCPRLVGLAGTCNLNNTAGVTVGTATIALK